MATPMELFSMHAPGRCPDREAEPPFRPVPYLFDIVLRAGESGGLVFPATGTAVDARGLVVHVRRCDADDCDVRIIAPDGARHAGVLRELADLLGRDVYATPEGADVVAATVDVPFGRPGEAIAVDRETGRPARWIRIRPPEVNADLPAWFACIGGAIRRRGGIAAVPLPHGVAFATRHTFADLCALAGWTDDDPQGVSTVMVSGRDGAFEVGRYDGSVELVDGSRLADLVLASVGTLRGDIRLLVRWPAEPERRVALAANVSRFAASLDRMVWTPEPDGPDDEMAEALLPAKWRGWPPVPQRKPSTQDDPAPRASHRPHAITWLPAHPPVNHESTDLVAWTAVPVGPSLRSVAEPFLLLYRDADRLAARHRGGHLLGLRAPAGSVVELEELSERLPPTLAERVRRSNATHLLPVAWLAGVTVTATYDLDGEGGIHAVHLVDDRPLTVAPR